MESGKHLGKSQQSIGAIPIAISSVFVTVTLLCSDSMKQVASPWHYDSNSSLLMRTYFVS